MKKLFAIFAVAAFVFAACGQKKAEATEPTTDVVVEETVVTEAPAEEVAPLADEVAETPAEEVPAE